MTQHFLPGLPDIPVVMRRSSRARRISLRVSRLDGRVTLTLPKGVREREGLEFVLEKADWLRKQLADRPDQVRVGLGSEVLLEGRRLQVVAGAGRQVRVSGGEIAVPGDPARVGARVQGFLKEQARARLVAASDRYAARLGRPYARLTLRDTRSRWGSCSSKGALMYSWRLIMAPASVLEYVAGHEVAHLQEMNHSDRFWDLVEEIHGPYAAPRRWLRDHGEELHRYRFAD
ncbi:SprT family zinc-dependent metalloprotease [uncultured Shimia sp.]|uniref:M48 family metallopeptidase n=1 Tax=uncultured Shimia sp. TaxID=573152 RepID=UPI00261DE941|nr:SprT family zinc-dependent metalloprotease [uncultured Shimia sp.]